MNRVIEAINKTEQTIKERLEKGIITQEAIDKLNVKLNMELDEYCKFQELKSAAMGTKLTLDEANTIYGYLGNSLDCFNNQPVAVKSVLTRIYAELLASRIKGIKKGN